MFGDRVVRKTNKGFDMIKQNEKTMIRENETKTLHPEKVLQQVSRVRRSKLSRDRQFALLVGAAVLAVMTLVAMLIESQLNLFSYPLRFGLTLVSLAATVVCAWKLWMRGNQNNERLVSAAKDIDKNNPTFEQRVSTLTSCKEDQLAEEQRVHPAMLNRLTEETITIHQRVQPKSIVSYKMLKLPLICLAAAALILIGFFAWDTPKTLVQLGRFCAPWSNISTTSVTAVDADLVAARNEPFKLTASLAGRPVNEVVFLSKNIDGSDSSTTTLWPSTKDNTVASVRQSKAVDSFDYRFRAGDGQSNWHRVTVADRPKIEDLTMRVVPPAYTGKPAKTFQQRLPKKLRVVAGSRLEVEVKPKSSVRTARLVMGKTDWLPLEMSTDGQYEGALDLRRPVKFQVQLTELHGLVNRRPPNCDLQVVADRAPKIKILKPTKTTILLPDEAIDIHFKATDDHGIQEMELRVFVQRDGEDVPTLHEVEIPIESESNNRKIKGSVELDLAQFNLETGDTVRYEIRASDNFRPLDGVGEPTAQTDLNPMKDVALEQSATTLDANKFADASASNASTNNEDSSSSTAQETPEAASSDVAAAETSDEKSAEVASDSTNDQADAAEKVAAIENQDPSFKSAKENSQAAPSDDAAKPSDDKNTAATDNAIAQTKSPPPSEPKAEQSPPDKIADASPEDSSPDSALKENKAQAATPAPKDKANDSKPSAIAKSDPPMKQAEPAKATPSAPAASSAPNKNSSPSPASQANQSQQANAPKKNMDSSPSSQPKQKLLAKKEEQPRSEKTEKDPSQSNANPVAKAMRPSGNQVGQSSSSDQQQIKVDMYGGGFNSEQRQELEIAISPVFELMKKSLISAGENVRKVMSDPTTGPDTSAALSSAEGDLKIASQSVIGLNAKTKGTPYVFVGLRLESIRVADVMPASEEVRKATDTQDAPRLEHSQRAWNHISRALASLGKLEEKYDQVRRDLKRADDILRFKKMHQVFVEKSLKMLTPQGPDKINRQNRKGAEYDLDEEYLKRLKEVMEMRRDMMAELARILADDPQLLRRFMNKMNDRTADIRDQLTLIAHDQQALSLRVSQWSGASAQPLELAKHQAGALQMHLVEVEGIFNRLADVQNKFISWLPLVESAEQGDVADTVANFKAAGTGMAEILADVEAMFVDGVMQPDASRQIDPLLAKATEVEKKLTVVAQSLQQLNRDSTDPEIVNNAARRFPKLQMVQRDMQLWADKLELLKDGLVHEAYSVDQENRRDQLLKYSVKIATLESQLVAAMNIQDAQLPDGVPEQTQILQKLVDAELPAAQLLAAQSLMDANAASANLQQQEITQDFEKAERTFDEILQAIADELDKLPPEDPIASLLRDPTLDEILAELEQELDSLESLDLSRRPSNLRIMGLGNRMQRVQFLSNIAFRNAMSRARAQVKSEPKKRKLAKDKWRWNLLVSELDEDMLQGDNKIPPERYRSAIEQYTDQISKLKNSQEEND